MQQIVIKFTKFAVRSFSCVLFENRPCFSPFIMDTYTNELLEFYETYALSLCKVSMLETWLRVDEN